VSKRTGCNTSRIGNCTNWPSSISRILITDQCNHTNFTEFVAESVEAVVSAFRNILIVTLVLCVSYNGYLIYQNHRTSDQKTSETVGDAPLFSEKAFQQLSKNTQPAKPSQQPVVVIPDATAASQTISNPVHTQPSDSSKTTVMPVAAELSPTASRFSNASPTEQVSSDVPLAAEQAEPALATEQDIETAWSEIESLEDGFRLAEALKAIQDLLCREDLDKPRREKAIAKGNELAEMVIFQPGKHLAKPAFTFLPKQTLPEIAAEHQIPVSLLKQINGWNPSAGPTVGDSIKVLQGPVQILVDLPRHEAVVSIGGLFAKQVPLSKQKLADHPSIHEIDRALPQEQVETVATLIESESDNTPVAEDMRKASDANLQFLQNIADANTKVQWIGKPLPEPTLVATIENQDQPEPKAQPIPEEAVQMPDPVTPVDALRMEVFAPTGKTLKGSRVKFGVRITNLSEQESDVIQLVVNLSEGIEPVEVDGLEGKVSVGQAYFTPTTVPAGETVQMSVTVQTLEKGQFVVRPELQCASPQTRYATEVQLQVADLPISVESDSTGEVTVIAEKPGAANTKQR